MFKLPNQNHKKVAQRRFSNGNEEAAPGTPLFRKKLDGGVQAEANQDGTIFIDPSVEPGGDEERLILVHEMKHLTDMKIGRMKYDDDSITWDGNKHPRHDGRVLYNGEWLQEGSKEFPWEKH
tara:strand:+ start:368 stop:733 length:366 start_codon:yes stop_codon:yes gene_type:complete